MRSSATVQEDKAAIEAFYRTWMGSGVKGAAAYASHYAADGQILPPSAAPIVGREAIAGRTESGRWGVAYRMWSDNRRQ